MNLTKTFFIVLCAVFFYGKSIAQDVQRKVCQGTDLTKWTDCYWKGSYSNGDKYEGEFKEGAFNGLGSYYFFSNGDKYVGEFKGGKRHGQGIYIRLDGSMLLGDWVEGKADGNFIEYGANRQLKRSGIYKDGKLVTSQYIDPNSFTRTEAARAAEDKRLQESKDADEKRIQEATAEEERVIWLTTPEGKKFTANEEAKAKKLEAERLRLSAQEAAIAKKQEAERLRLFAIEEAKVKKQEAERLRLFAIEEAKAKKQQEQLRLVAAKQVKNKELEKTRENCPKITGTSSGVTETISQTLKVSAASIIFLRGEYSANSFGCVVVVDTPKGIKRCGYMWILDSGKKDGIFAASPSSGFWPMCD